MRRLLLRAKSKRVWREGSCAGEGMDKMEFKTLSTRHQIRNVHNSNTAYVAEWIPNNVQIALLML